MDINQTVKRPYLKYYGGAWDRAEWIIPHLPYRPGYFEPFAGASSVFFRKQAQEIEVLNDLNGRVFNALYVLRTWPEELKQALELTPWHENEYRLSKTTSPDMVEDARRFWCLCWMSVIGGPAPGKSGFRIQKSSGDRYGRQANYELIDLDHLYTLARRLKNAHITNRNALRMLKGYIGRDVTIYADPPYPHRTRQRKDGYGAGEFATADHEELAALLTRMRGPVVLSGYAKHKDGSPNKLYSRLYENKGWRRVDRDYQTNAGGIRTEAIWLNQAAQDWGQLPLLEI